MQRIAHMRRELKKKTAKLAELNALLQRQANEDGLTKIYNRRYIDEQLGQMLGWYGRHRLPISVILLDIDNFKLFNDNYGHIEGDKCLQATANTIKSLFQRNADCVGRYGGESVTHMRFLLYLTLLPCHKVSTLLSLMVGKNCRQFISSLIKRFIKPS